MAQSQARVIPMYSKLKSPLSNFPLTLLQAIKITQKGGLKTQPKYQKLDFKSSLIYPYYHKFNISKQKTFYDLFLAYGTLLQKDKIGQVFGTVKPEYIETKSEIRRSKEYLTYFDKDLAPIIYNYLVIEYDDKEGLDLIPAFKTRYLNKELNKAILEEQTRVLLTKIFPLSKTDISDLPIILRLSSSFYKSAESAFRAHIIIPTEDFTPPAIAPLLKALNPNIDPSIYRSPNQILFSSSPEFKTISDPLQENIPTLDRIYFFGSPELAKNNKTIPRIDLNRELKNAIPSFSKSSALSKSSDSFRIKPAWELSGDAGLFNLRVHQNNFGRFSIESWLLNQGYTASGKYRYISPASDSGSAGLILLRGEYVYDHHENSPIKDIIPYPDRMLSAYDLYYHQYIYENRLPEFKKIIFQIRSTSPEYKKKEYEELKGVMSFIHADLSKAELAKMINSLMGQIFNSRLDPQYKDALFREVSEKTKNSEFPYKSKDLKKIWKELTTNLSEEIGNIDPGSPEDVNSKHFLRQVALYYNTKGKYHIIKHPRNPILVIPDNDELKRYVWVYVEELSMSLGWSHSKMTSQVNNIIRKSETSSIKKPEDVPDFSPHLYLFKNSYETINVFTGEILPLPETSVVLNELPFTKQSYLLQKKRPSEAWKSFMLSSFPNKEDRDLLQHILAYLISPTRKEQRILFLYGVPRSGKSTLKNLFGKMFPGLSVELSMSKLSDGFSISKLTPFSRLIVINEFNVEGAKKNIDEGVNLTKEISGRDEIQTRGMRENFKTFVSDALPILISNTPPTIRDKAFQERLIPIHFKHTFSNQSDLEFQRDLQEALPTIFHWGLRLLSTDETTISFKKIIRTEYIKEMKASVLREIDTLGAFASRFLEPGIAGSKRIVDKAVGRKDLLYWYRAYHEKEMGQPFEEKSSKDQWFPTIRDLKKIFPGLDIVNKRPIIKHRKTPCVYGIKWKDKGEMKINLSDFGAEVED